MSLVALPSPISLHEMDDDELHAVINALAEIPERSDPAEQLMCEIVRELSIREARERARNNHPTGRN